MQKLENEIKKIMVEIYYKETESMKDEKEIKEIQPKRQRLETDTIVIKVI